MAERIVALKVGLTGKKGHDRVRARGKASDPSLRRKDYDQHKPVPQWPGRGPGRDAARYVSSGCAGFDPQCPDPFKIFGPS